MLHAASVSANAPLLVSLPWTLKANTTSCALLRHAAEALGQLVKAEQNVVWLVLLMQQLLALSAMKDGGSLAGAVAAVEAQTPWLNSSCIATAVLRDAEKALAGAERDPWAAGVMELLGPAAVLKDGDLTLVHESNALCIVDPQAACPWVVDARQAHFTLTSIKLEMVLDLPDLPVQLRRVRLADPDQATIQWIERVRDFQLAHQC